MPIFKVTITEIETKVFVAYVDAATYDEADGWACMLENADVVGCCVDIRNDNGDVDSIEEVSEVPTGQTLSAVKALD